VSHVTSHWVSRVSNEVIADGCHGGGFDARHLRNQFAAHELVEEARESAHVRTEAVGASRLEQTLAVFYQDGDCYLFREFRPHFVDVSDLKQVRV